MSNLVIVRLKCTVAEFTLMLFPGKRQTSYRPSWVRDDSPALSGIYFPYYVVSPEMGPNCHGLLGSTGKTEVQQEVEVKNP